MYGGLIGTYQHSFKCYPIQPPLPQDWGCATPKIGGAQPPLKTAIWLSDEIVGKFAHLRIYCWQQKCSAEKCTFLQYKFCGMLTVNRALKRSPSL